MRVLSLVLLAGLILSIAGWLPAAGTALVGSLAALIAPGVLLLALIRRTGDPGDRLLTGIALSPVVLGLLLTLAFLLDVNGSSATRGFVLGATASVCVLSWLHRPGPAASGIGPRPWIAGAVVALGVALILVLNPWRREASDAWFHTAVVYELQRAGVPPQDPYFADLRLQYFWFYHVVVLALGHLTALRPPESMAVLNVAAAFLAVPAAARVVTGLGFPRGAGPWAGLLLLLGMGGLFWLFFPVKLLLALTGDVTGMEQVRQSFSLAPFGVDRASFVLQVLYSSTFLLRKFLVATALSWCLLLILVMLDSGIRFVRSGGAGRAAVFATAAAGAFLFHVIVGGAAVAAAVVGGLGLAVLRRRPRRGLVLAAAGSAALLASLPYLGSVAGAKETENLIPVGFHFWHLVSLPVTVGAVGLLSWPAVRRLGRAGDPVAIWFLGFAAASVGYGLLARLPGPNQFDKPPIIVFVPLALLAGASVPLLLERWRGARRRVLLAFLFLVLVPENALMGAAFLLDRPGRTPGREEVALYRWIGENTPRGAVVLDSRDRVEVLVRGPRRQYWGKEGYASMWGYPEDEMDRRRTLRDRVYATAPPASGDLLPLRSLDAPVYIVAREEDAPGIRERLSRVPDLERVWSEGAFSVFRYRGSAS